MPTRERVEQLLEIVLQELEENPGANLAEYHDWDHLVEDQRQEDVMTFEEWEWCRDNMKVERSVSVSIGDLGEK